MQLSTAVLRSARQFKKSAPVNSTRTICSITGISNFYTFNGIPRSLCKLSFVDSRSFSVAGSRSLTADVDHKKKHDDLTPSAILLSWRKKAGDSIAKGDVIVVVETDAVTMDIRAKKAGVFVEGLISAQEDISVGAELYKMETSATAADAAAAAAATAKPAAARTRITPAALKEAAGQSVQQLLDWLGAEKEAAEKEKRRQERMRIVLIQLQYDFIDLVATPALREYKNDPTLTCDDYLEGALDAACIKRDLTERYKEVDAAINSKVKIQQFYEFTAELLVEHLHRAD